MRRHEPRQIPPDYVFSKLGDRTEEARFYKDLNVTRQRGRQLLDRAGLQFIKIGGRRFYRDADIEFWIEHGVAPVRRRPRKPTPAQSSPASSETSGEDTAPRDVRQR